MNDLSDLAKMAAPVETPSTNGGVYFRCRINRWIGSNHSLNEKVTFTLLKRRSDMSEFFAVSDSMSMEPNDVVFPDSKDLVDGGIYRAECVLVSRDYETGYWDEWYWRLVLDNG